VEGGVAQRKSAQAKRGRLGCLLSRARDGVPQQAWFPCTSVKHRDCFGGFFRVDVAGRNSGEVDGAETFVDTSFFGCLAGSVGSRTGAMLRRFGLAVALRFL
jgi:hypothetical protein